MTDDKTTIATLTAQLAEAQTELTRMRDGLSETVETLAEVKRDMWRNAALQWTKADFLNWAIVQRITETLESARALLEGSKPSHDAALSRIKREAEDAGIKIGLRAGATWLRTVPEELAHRQVYAAAILALTPDEARKLGEEE